MRKLLVILILGLTSLLSEAAARWETVDAPDRMFTEMRSDPEAQIGRAHV